MLDSSAPLNTMRRHRRHHHVANMIVTAAAITAVHNHPIAHNARGSTNRSITSWRIARSIITTMYLPPKVPR